MNDPARTYSQHPVPQHVLGVEFKLIGDMTLKQFAYAAGALVLAYLIYSSLLPFIFRIPLALIILTLGLSLAFLPVNDRPMDEYLRNFLWAMATPTERVWVKEIANLDIFYENLSPIINEAPSPEPKDRKNLREYIGKLKTDKARSTLDLKEEEYLKSLDNEFASAAAASQPTPEPTAPALPPPPTFRPERVEIKPTPTLASEFNFTNQELISIPTASQVKKYVTTIKNIKVGRKLHSLPTIEGEIVMPVAGEIVLRSEEAEVPESEDLVEKAQMTLDQLDRHLTQMKETAVLAAVEKSQLNQAAKRQSEAILSPPGPKIAVDENLQKMAEQTAKSNEELTKLRQQNEALLLQVNREKRLREEAEKSTEEARGFEEKIHYLQEQNEQMNKEIKRSNDEHRKVQGESANSRAERENSLRTLKEQQRRLEALAQEKAESLDEIVRLQKELQTLRNRTQKAAKDDVLSLPRLGLTTGASSTTSKAIPFVRDIPNVINGYVRDKNGALLKNAVIIIKDQNSDVVRALKTNELGQFAITTPLPNGNYQVGSSFAGITFDIMTVDLMGTVLEPLEFQGR